MHVSICFFIHDLPAAAYIDALISKIYLFLLTSKKIIFV